MLHHQILGEINMEAFVEQIIGNIAFIKFENGQMMRVAVDKLPKGIKVDDILLYENGKFIMDPKSKEKKAALAEEIEKLTKELFTEVKTYTDDSD
jgi:hypothetical protein